jgi:hypothetical protein
MPRDRWPVQAQANPSPASSDVQSSDSQVAAALKPPCVGAEGPQYRLHKGSEDMQFGGKWVQPFPRTRMRLAPRNRS